MKDMTGYLKRILLFFSLIFGLFFTSKSPIYADNEFEISTIFKHTITEDSQINTIIDISLKANDRPRVLSFYTITIEKEDIDPEIILVNSTKNLNSTIYNRDGATDLAVTFSELIISDTKTTTLRISYTEPLSIEGNKIMIDSSLSEIDTDSIIITYPKTMGDILWSSNTLSKFSAQGDYYKAEISKPISPDTILVLGDSLTYNFTISRSLNNTLEESSQTFDITLPQDNLTQTLVIESISPQPDFSSRDEEGNLTVSYIVEAQKQIDVIIKGEILVLESLIKTEEPTNPFLIKESNYWKISNEQEISNIDRYIDRNWVKLPDNFDSINDFNTDTDKEKFYKGIYKYIVTRLDVDKTSNTVLQGGTRDGAEAVLKNVSKADADDYADLCVATYRHYGIPARMNVGYLTDVSGITEDGIFHSWCEYYNLVEKSWVQVDPFLEEYKSVDLYKSSLRDHIKILTRGKSSLSPKLAFYSENDFNAKSISSEITPILSFDSNILFKNIYTTSQFVQGSIYIKNTGNIPITKFSIIEENVPISSNIDAITNEATLLLLPGEDISIPFNIPIEEFNEKEDKKDIKISIQCSSESQFSKSVSVESNLEIKIPIWIEVLSFSISLICFIGIVFLIYLGYRKFKT